jgi:hypothetical protein
VGNVEAASANHRLLTTEIRGSKSTQLHHKKWKIHIQKQPLTLG